MLKKRKIIIIVEIVMLVLAISIFGAMAFLSINGKQELANTFTSGCLKITLSDVTDAITLNGAFPITDIEGLEQEESYKFQIKNSCDTETQYKINLESINKQNNTLDSEYVKVALSSNTMDNLIMKLDPKDITVHYLEDAYQSHNLYEGILKANETKEFTLKEWLDYDTTKEEGANKIYQSKIYVVSDSRDQITEKPEIKFTYSDGKVKGIITGSVNNLTYCETKDNICEPTNEIVIEDSGVTLESKVEATTNIVSTTLGNLKVNTTDMEMICSKLDDGKTICSNPYGGESNPDFAFTSDAADKGLGRCIFSQGSISTYYDEDVPKETCGTVYEVKTQDNDVSYYDSSLEQHMTYMGKATWNNETLTCEYNGNEVYDWNFNSIEEKNCGDVYESDEIYFTMITKLEEQAEWKLVTGKTGIYETKDEDGTSYYYRGAVENNYAEFAGFYWRIIRINGNGSIRLLYNGKKDEINAIGKETILENGYNNGEYTTIKLTDENKTTPFNRQYDNVYVGFMYGDEGATTYDNTHKNEHDSIVKEKLDIWYIENLKSVEDKLDVQSGFCGDRSLGVGYENVGYGKEDTNYGAYDRIGQYGKYQPTLKCKNKENDYFTWKGHASTGNQALNNPVGLITADEVMYGGGSTSDNYTYYLYNGIAYWTMTPYYFYGGHAYAFNVQNNGFLRGDIDVLIGDASVRPVINVDSKKVRITGHGTIDDMYIFS